jgi:DNA invertase Pin-like site-specific DNA recombinase
MSKTACYVRTSLVDQGRGLDSQERAVRDYLRNHGLEAKFYTDEESAGTLKRPGFEKLQRDIFAGKVRTVVCWKLDRLSRSLKDGINVLCDWLEKDVRVVSVSQQLDFSGPVGQLVASVLFAVAQMERENLRENTRRGMAAAKARGVRLGKRPKLFAKDIAPLLDQGLTMAEAARRLGKSRQACYTALAREEQSSVG